MGSGMDDAKGKAKEAAGDLTDDTSLEHEGKTDQAGATIKDKLGDAKEKIGGLVDKAKDKLTHDK